MNDFSIRTVSKDEARPFILGIHYAKRFPPFKHLFGLVEDGKLVGVVSYGPPVSPQVPRSVFGGVLIERVVELSRLVIVTPTKNAASFLIGRTMQMLPKPSAVVSYADGMQGHVGYIYQACNFIYTGSVKAHDNYYRVDGKLLHPRSLADRGITSPAKWAAENGIEIVLSQPKPRYIYFLGNKSQIREMKSAVKWNSLPYPKGESRRYDAPNADKKNNLTPENLVL